MSPSWIPNGSGASWSENSWSGARWVEYSIGIPYNISLYGQGSGALAGTEQKQFWFYCLRGLVQTGLVTLAILGLHRLGLRVGFYDHICGDHFCGDRSGESMND